MGVQTADMVAQMLELDVQDSSAPPAKCRKVIGIEEGICETTCWIRGVGPDCRTGQPFFLRSGDFCAFSRCIDWEYESIRPVKLEQNPERLNGPPLEDGY